jgi:hypothetical protein
VRLRHPTYPLVTEADAPLPAGAPEGDWRIARSRPADDVNAQVREAIAASPAPSD